MLTRTRSSDVRMKPPLHKMADNGSKHGMVPNCVNVFYSIIMLRSRSAVSYGAKIDRTLPMII